MINGIVTYLTGLTASNEIISSWGSVLVVGRNLFIYEVPSTPNNIIVLSPYGGIAPDDTRAVLHPTVQVRIRCTTPLVAYNTSMAIIKDFHHSSSLTNGLCFALNSAPFPMGLDSNGRMTYAMNFRFKYIYE